MSYGAWSLGINDPTWIGWLTTVAYFAAAGACFRAFRRSTRRHGEASTWWLGLALALFALGFNKQLDLQTLLIQFGKLTAIRHGWYEQRRIAQFFVVGLMFVVSVAAARGIWVLGKRQTELRVSLMGAAILVIFVFLRASAFQRAALVPKDSCWNAVIELIGIAVVGIGTTRIAPGNSWE